MLGVTTPEMVAAVSEAGGLGSLPIGGLSPDRSAELIRKTKALTSKPFAVNLFAYAYTYSIDEDEYDAMQAYLKQVCSADGIEAEQKPFSKQQFYNHIDQIGLLIEEGIKLVSFTFGVLDDESIETLKRKNTILMGTATSVREAMILDEKEVDIICAQGSEAGGHRGSFLNMLNPPLIGSIALIPAIVQATTKPVIAAGAIADGASIHAAFNLGAKAVQIGTPFTTSHESLATLAWKKALQSAADTEIILTNTISGRWARGVRNKLMDKVQNSGLSIPAYPVQNILTTPIRAAAYKQDNPDYLVMWRGQSPVPLEQKSSAEIFNKLIRQAEEFAAI